MAATPYLLTGETQLFNLLFDGLLNCKWTGYGTKRLAVNIPGTISETIPLRAYGYRDTNDSLFIGLRLYLDQDAPTKIIPWHPNTLIMDHLTHLVHLFDKEYTLKINNLLAL